MARDRVFAALVCSSIALCGQAFEAASVKPAAPVVGRGGRATASGDRVTYANTTLLNALARAYDVKGYQIDGPAWIRTERYDILAKAGDGTPKDQLPLMMQALLSERFQLKLHREQREMNAFVLVAGKGKPKYQKTEGDEVGYDMSSGKRVLKSHTMTQLADMLALILRAPVFDRTELQGRYDIPLEMSQEEIGAASDATRDQLSIFTIIENLGLKLESRKEPVAVLVVDSGNKVPSEN
jgi:uncharacterized protein (TIGR03435 family)